MKKFRVRFLTTLLLLALTACNNDVTGPGNTQYYSAGMNITVSEALSANASDHEESGDYSWGSASVSTIALNGSAITASGSGVNVAGSIATITSGGDYLISGTLNDGRIIVDSDDSETVRLILSNAHITSSTNAPISVSSAEKTVIILADGTSNYVTDPSSYVFASSDDDEPNAAIFSQDDLSISGNGSLTVDANYNDGIASKDGLVINGGTLRIDAADDGIRGKDYLVIRTGSITIDAGGDALKSDNDEDGDKGYILIENGNIDLTCDADGFDAETDALIVSGTFSITTGGGSSVTPGEDSTKGIKGSTLVVIESGTLDIDASDDAIHSNTSIVINSGVFSIASGDDAIHADESLVINDGSINITTCVEGIESNIIVVDDGTIRVTASDDGINATAGTDTQSYDGSCAYINGGYIVLTSSAADGLDSNGDVVMTNGTVIIHGAVTDREVTVDYNGTFNISGGLLVTAGSDSRTLQSLSSSSTQNSILIMFSSPLAAATLVHIEDSSGNSVVTFEPIQQYQTVLYSSSQLVRGNTYTVYLGGTSSGMNTDGVYSGGTYSGGTPVSTFTVSETVTVVR